MKNLLLFVGFIFIIGETCAQNVGVGTNSPVAKLDVVGTIKITDGTQGEGKVLTSDATGLASWQSQSDESSTTYPTVWICCSAWMTKNLDVATYRNGDPIPKVTSNSEWAALTTGAYCYYNNDSATYAAVYGKLYNWYAVNDPRGLAPEGWRVPTDFEWTTLGSCIGGSSNGGLLKEMGTAHWSPPNEGATNQTHFTALPGGNRLYDGSFGELGTFGFWWTATEYDTDSAWNRALRHDSGSFTSPANIKQTGYSVRCIRD
jgi:uncharacterized protein (TIGR02145 family)